MNAIGVVKSMVSIPAHHRPKRPASGLLQTLHISVPPFDKYRTRSSPSSLAICVDLTMLSALQKLNQHTGSADSNWPDLENKQQIISRDRRLQAHSHTSLPICRADKGQNLISSRLARD